MTFLELCQRLRNEAGISGTGPLTVVGQTGEYQKVVNWISSAYEDIQNIYADWKFLTNDVDFSTVIGTQSYTPTMAGISDLATWKAFRCGDIRCYLTASDEQYLDVLPWENFKTAYLFGASRSQAGKPIACSIKPDNSIVFYPIPDKEYTIVGEYFQTDDIMTSDSDTPIIPLRFQMIIVWRALMLYGAFEAADEKYAHGQNEYKKILGKLRVDQGPMLSFGGALV